MLPTTIGGDEIESVYIVITDVTDAAVAHLALEAAHTELEREMEERKRLQADLLLSQKLSAVGQLAAGVAHEMNTPLQYLYDNVSFLSDVLQDVTAVLTRYRAAIAETEVSPAIVESLRALEEDMDLDFLLDRYPKTLQSSTKGLDRLARLVTSMKAFRAADQANIVDADINGAIDATMTVIRGQLPSTTEVKIDLDDIPTVECQLGEINEAIFNLILNASDAIDDAQREHGLIEVTTTHIDDQVEISISDNGCGIPPHVQDRIFDPFFTTKSVGHGTGQGLHVSRSVAERHGGSLRFEPRSTAARHSISGSRYSRTRRANPISFCPLPQRAERAIPRLLVA